MKPTLRFAPFVLLAAVLGLAATASARGPIGNLEGTVLDSKGKPVADATVTLQSSDGKSPFATHTDSTGHFTFTRHETGLYDLRAYSNGMFSDWVKHVWVKSKKTAVVTLRMPPPADESVTVTR